jgi:cysteine sulfinate desulfinase/cysteine desulfurase-like protein
LFFVSGSTEANNLILRGLLDKNDTIIISKMEHPSIYETALDISPNNTLYVNNNSDTGMIDL